MRALVVIAISIASAAGATSTVAAAHPASTSVQKYVMTVTLTPGAQIPAPRHAADARGTLTGTLVIDGKKSSFVWHLKFTGLTGAATATALRFGTTGKTGPLALPLCNNCRNPSLGAYHGPYVANRVFLPAILHGGLYAVLTTKQNPKGEIRGQVKVKTGSA